jgi:hypothetical protein
MKNKNLTLVLMFAFALLACFSLSGFASAERIVNYNVYEATIEDNGSLNTTTNFIGDFNYVGYVCFNVNCTQIGNQITGLTGYSNSGVLRLLFPTNLLNNNGYVVYLYKEGYIGWEQRNIIRYGTGEVNSNTAFYLSKKRTGFAPIMNLSVLNEIAPYKPLEVNVTTGIDSQTYAALRDNHVSGINLADSEKVNTTITLEIKNASGEVIKTETRNVAIPYSQSIVVNFEHNFTQTGKYNVSVYSDVTDAKIINSIRQMARANVQVIEQNLTNYSYAKLNDLVYVPQFPIVNQTMNFSIGYISNFINSSNSISALNCTLFVDVKRNNVLVENKIFNLSGGNTTIFNNFNFNMGFNQVGNYVLTARARPNPELGNLTTEDTQIVSFVVAPGNNTNQTIPDDDDEDDNNVIHKKINCTYESPELEDSLPLVMSNYTITLEPKKNGFEFKALLYWLIIACLVLLIVIILVYIFKMLK